MYCFKILLYQYRQYISSMILFYQHNVTEEVTMTSFYVHYVVIINVIHALILYTI
jgi:hypothetical protein